MAKIFYTLDEASRKLKMSNDQVRCLCSSGQLQEFRDRDKIMLKVDQVDLLASGNDDSGCIPLVGTDDTAASLLDLTSKADFTFESDDTRLGQAILEEVIANEDLEKGIQDFKDVNGRVVEAKSLPATTIDRFAHFTRREMSTLRTALMTLRAAENRAPEVENLINEINSAKISPGPKRGLFARLFGKQ